MNLLLIIGIISYIGGMVAGWMYDGVIGIVAGICVSAGAAIIVIDQYRKEDEEMNRYTMMQKIREKYGDEYLLRQLSEECCELGQAALKLIRAMHYETPMTREVAREKLMEEMADVKVMWDAVRDVLMSDGERTVMNMWEDDKLDRMERRMLGGDQGDAKRRTSGKVR